MSLICQTCGFSGNPNNATSCQQCYSILTPTASNPQLGGSNQQPTTTTPNQSASQVQTSSFNTTASTGTVNPVQLTGMVTWVESTIEHIDFNYYKFFSQLIMFFMFLPLIAGIFFLSFIFWITFAILGFHTLARDVSPFNIANTINAIGVLVAIAFPRLPQANQVPAIRLTIQNSNGERSALIKGELQSGTFRRGDMVDLTGIWRNGMLFVLSGYNQTLQTGISIRRDYWRFVFWGLIIFHVILFLSLFFSII